MIILFIFVASFLPLLQCDSNTAFVWTAKAIDGGSSFELMYGDPDIYLQNFANGNYDSENSYTRKSYTVTSSVFKTIAYDAGSEYVAISEIRNGTLQIYKLSDLLGDYGFVLKYIFDDLRNITGLAFATNFNLLYFVDSNIGVIDLTRNHRTKFNIQTFLEEPHSIAVHEENRFLFWSDIGLKPKIIRSNLYGEERKVIVYSSLKRPTNLVVDKQSERLFWLDGDLKSCDFNGNDIVTYNVPNAGIHSTYVIYKDIAIFGTSNGNQFYSYKISRNGSRSFTSYVFLGTGAIISSSLDSKEFAKSISNPCSSNQCDFMCFPNDDTTYVCKCSPGYILGSDGWTCIQSNNTAFFWTAKTIDGSSTFNVMYGDPDIYLQKFANGNYDSENSYKIKSYTVNSNVLEVIAYDARTEYVAISEIQYGRLLIYELKDVLGNNSFSAKYLFEDIRNVTGLAFAGNYNLLYFVDSYIGVIDLARNHRIKFNNQTFLEEPYSIAVHEENRYLFWSDIGLKPKIIRTNLYGEERIVIVDSSVRPTNLVVDKQSGRLFWLDGDLKSCSYTGDYIYSYNVPGIYSTFVIYKDISIFDSSYGFHSYKITQKSSRNFSSFAYPSTKAIISASIDSKEFVKSISNPCLSNRCDFMCFPQDGTKYVCKCSSGYILSSDGWTCS